VGRGGVVSGGPETVVTTSSGRMPSAASRLESVIAVALVVVSAMLTGPLPLTRPVTSTSLNSPAVRGPEEPTTAPTGGALSKVIAVSPQVVLATPRTW
jgi:hypothetical protein